MGPLRWMLMVMRTWLWQALGGALGCDGLTPDEQIMWRFLLTGTRTIRYRGHRLRGWLTELVVSEEANSKWSEVQMVVGVLGRLETLQ